MQTVRIVNAARCRVLAERATVADSFLRRGWGLLGRARLGAQEGMVLTKTNCIHSLFMRFPIDALYVDKDQKIIRSLSNLRPYRVGPYDRRAKTVVELPAGTIECTGTQVGDVVNYERDDR